MQSTRKKPAADFVIKLVAPGLRPWDVPARSLWHIIIAIQRLIERNEPAELAESGEPAEEPSRPEASIQLLDVVAGSAAYPLAARDPSAALKVLAETGKGLSNPAKADWDAAALSSLDEISRAAKSIGCAVEIRGADKNGRVLATITPQSYDEVSRSVFVTGKSSVYGYLERVGGATQPHCGLRVATQPARMVICHVAGRDLAQRLGPHVYEYVRVSGTFTWLRRNWQIKSIDVEAFEPVKRGPMREALSEIWEAGGKAWDDVDDPSAVIKGMR